MRKGEKFTPKMLMFCKEYLLDLNGKEAAIRAGYSEQTAAEQAYHLLQKKAVQDKISKLMTDRMRKLEISGEDVVKEFLSIANDDIGNYLKFYTSEDGEMKVEVKDSESISTKNISEITIAKDGSFKFKLYSRENALLQLGRHMGIFNDKMGLNVNEELMNVYKKLMSKK